MRMRPRFGGNPGCSIRFAMSSGGCTTASAPSRRTSIGSDGSSCTSQKHYIHVIPVHPVPPEAASGGDGGAGGGGVSDPPGRAGQGGRLDAEPGACGAGAPRPQGRVDHHDLHHVGPPSPDPKLVVSIPVTRAGDGPEEVEGSAPDAPQDARGA
jgi:hypothetical protein